MRKKIHLYRVILVAVLVLSLSSCSKKAFDINSPNPNQPSTVTPDFVLSAALTASANIMLGGDANFANEWMGYWAPYGEQSPSVLSYNLTTDLYSGNWDDTYVVLENYKFIADHSTAPEDGYFLAISKIMTAFH